MIAMQITILIFIFICLCWYLFVKIQGEAKFIFLIKKRTPLEVVRENDNDIEMTCSVPFYNGGKQFGSLIDVFPRHYLPNEQCNKLVIDTNLYRVNDPRNDNYWCASVFYVGEGDDIIINLKFISKQENIVTVLSQVPDLPIDIYYQAVSRKDYYIHKERIVFTTEEINSALTKALLK